MSGGFVLYNTIDGTNAEDQLVGSNGMDLIRGYASHDIISGCGGDDVIMGGSAGDYMDGGAGIDTVDYSESSAAVQVELLSPFNLLHPFNPGQGAAGGDAAGDVLVNIEDLVGSNYADTLCGDAGKNEISGGNSGDYLLGHAGNDTLMGGAGHDTLIDEPGNDTMSGGHDGNKFIFDWNPDTWYLHAGGHDVITDFAPGKDRLDIMFTNATNDDSHVDQLVLDTNHDSKIDGKDAYCSDNGSSLFIDYGAALHAWGAGSADGYKGNLVDTVELKGVHSLSAIDFSHGN